MTDALMSAVKRSETINQRWGGHPLARVTPHGTPAWAWCPMNRERQSVAVGKEVLAAAAAWKKTEASLQAVLMKMPPRRVGCDAVVGDAVR